MDPIANGVSSYFPAFRSLRTHGAAVNDSLLKLSTARRINRGADDPAGLITSENLRAVLAAIEAEGRALQRTDHVASTADAALGELSAMLRRAEALTVANANTAGMSPEEIEANQMEIDSIVSTVNRLASQASFNGEPLFDGSTTLRAGDATLQLEQVSAASLGTTDIDGETFSLADVVSGGRLAASTGRAGDAQAVIRAAISSVAEMRGRIGAFQKHAVASRTNNLQTTLENVHSAESAIGDTDFAEETARLSRARVMTQAAIAGLKVNMQSAGTVLTLLDRGS